MLTMQTFYDKLFSTKTPQSTYLDCLVRLTQVSPREIEVLKSNITWDYWRVQGPMRNGSAITCDS